MAGGVGSRFWPLSRASQPKQFIDILGTGETLLQQTVRRLKKIFLERNIFIVTSEAYKDLTLTQIPEFKEWQVITEPARKNTAPCVLYASYKIHKLNPDANILVAPSDHIIMKEDVFVKVANLSLETAAKNDYLITIGITPHSPNTGYGYIQFEDTDETPEGVCKVKLFTEKPELEMAKQFLQSGDFLWNAGIFIWSSKSILAAFAQHLPEMDEIFNKGIPFYNTPNEKEFIADAYSLCRSISIDYGIMEKAQNAYVIPADLAWSDLGTWGALYDTRPKDENQNSIVGKNVMAYDTHGCLINMPKEKLTVVQGLEDCIIVEEQNILLICKRSEEQMLRQIVMDVTGAKGDKFI